LCNNTIDGEDDKCYYDGSDPIPLTVTAAPVPTPAPAVPVPVPVPVPVDTCFDKVDNDGDGVMDLDDLDAFDSGDPSKECDQIRRPMPLPTLTRATARSYVKTTLKRRFNDAYRHGYSKRIAGVRRLSRTKIRFADVSWVIGDLSYRGRVTIWNGRNGTEIWWNYAYRITRTNEHCRATAGRHCTKTYVVR
jgi:hypothetical protein